MSWSIAIAALAVLSIIWVIVCVLRVGRTRTLQAQRSHARKVLTTYARNSLEHPSINAIVAETATTSRSVFGTDEIVAILPTDSGWEAKNSAGAGLADVPTGILGLFSWFKHNPFIATSSDLNRSQYGAMRIPLRSLMDTYGVDVIMPLVDRDRVLAVLGFRLGRKLNMLDWELMRIFRLEATAACANVKLHHQAANLLSMAREVDLASSIELAMVPAVLSGSVGKITWAGHFEAGGTAGSDFWGLYPLEQGRVMVIMGDAVERDLAGTMVSAVIKSCCDEIFERRPKELNPAQLLALLNGSLFRPNRPALSTCFAALIDPTRSLLFYANAGHVLPYRMRREEGAWKVGSLAGSGPLLGDVQQPNFKVHKAPLAEVGSLVLLTNGLVDVTDRDGTPFGHGRFGRLLRRQETGDPEHVRAAILAAIAAYRGGASAADDQALLVVRCS